MVKEQDKDNAKRQGNQGGTECPAKANKIGHSTPYSYCSERLSPFGGLLGLVKFMELIQFKEIFAGLYTPPTRTRTWVTILWCVVLLCFCLLDSTGCGIFCIFRRTRCCVRYFTW